MHKALFCIHTLIRPTMLIPNFRVNSINHIHYEAFKQRGLKLIIYDLDNTLCFTNIYSPYPYIQPAFEASKKLFDILLLSNSVGLQNDSAFKLRGRELVLNYFKAKLCIHSAKKPFCGQEILQNYRYKPSEIMVVGDRLMTDILLANYNDFVSVYVEPIDDRENISIYLMRMIEGFIYKILGYRAPWKGKEQYQNIE